MHRTFIKSKFTKYMQLCASNPLFCEMNSRSTHPDFGELRRRHRRVEPKKSENVSAVLRKIMRRVNMKTLHQMCRRSVGRIWGRVESGHYKCLLEGLLRTHSVLRWVRGKACIAEALVRLLDGYTVGKLEIFYIGNFVASARRETSG